MSRKRAKLSPPEEELCSPGVRIGFRLALAKCKLEVALIRELVSTALDQFDGFIAELIDLVMEYNDREARAWYVMEHLCTFAGQHTMWLCPNEQHLWRVLDSIEKTYGDQGSEEKEVVKTRLFCLVSRV